ncbi:MAG: single-stranded-DNA-specific exonuclease RecJ [Filifactoraceae bacterium]
MEKWILKNKCKNYKEIANQLKIDPIIVKIITNRGIATLESIMEYLDTDIRCMYNPYILHGMEYAVNLFKLSMSKNEKITIVGDYDVDGIMSTTILLKGLKALNCYVETYIPHRIKDGYGINDTIVDSLFLSGTKLIITCDNGVSAFSAIKKAKELGIRVIVLDHHEFKKFENEKGEFLTKYVEADAIVNPKNPKCNYPFKNICGAVVTYKFVEALYSNLGKKFNYEQYIVYASFATVCDVVDLIDENRIILKEGLRLLNLNKPLGIYELCKVNNIHEKKLTAYDFGYILGPCLNASGRLEHANLALELMTTDSKSRAEDLSIMLLNLNKERKSLTDNGIKLATDTLENLNEGPIKVIYLNTVHESIAGIIAGRLKELFYNPFIIFTDSHEGILKGSARSVDGINIVKEIEKCENLLKGFGGHPMAAGLSLEKSNLDEFIKVINNDILTLIPSREIKVDMLLAFSHINLSLYKLIEELEPFGKANEKPLFAQINVIVLKYKKIGNEGQFVKLKVIDNTNTLIEALYFGKKIDKLINILENKNRKLDLIYNIAINEYKGNVKLQILIQEFRESR